MAWPVRQFRNAAPFRSDGHARKMLRCSIVVGTQFNRQSGLNRRAGQTSIEWPLIAWTLVDHAFRQIIQPVTQARGAGVAPDHAAERTGLAG